MKKALRFIALVLVLIFFGYALQAQTVTTEILNVDTSEFKGIPYGELGIKYTITNYGNGKERMSQYVGNQKMASGYIYHTKEAEKFVTDDGYNAIRFYYTWNQSDVVLSIYTKGTTSIFVLRIYYLEGLNVHTGFMK